jgi:hypothetical protein
MNNEQPNKKRKIEYEFDEEFLEENSSDEEYETVINTPQHIHEHPHHDVEWSDSENLDDICDYPDEDEIYSI